MLYYRLDKVVRKGTCSTCKEHMDKGDWYFKYYNKPKGSYRPDVAKICLNCAKEVSSPQFEEYLRKLLLGIVKVRVSLKEMF